MDPTNNNSTSQPPLSAPIRVELASEPVASVVAGPTAALNKNKYGYTSMQYPLDAGSKGKGHTVQFDICNIDSVSYQDLVEAGTNALDTTKETMSSGTNAANALLNGAEAVKNTFLNLGKTGTELINAVKPKTTKTVASVRLYMPETVNFTYGAQYNDLSLATAASSVPKLVGGIASAITSTLDNAAVRTAANKMGYRFNPQSQVMFDGIDFRTYAMSFTFTPVSEQESNAVNEIIKTFRKYAAPTIVKESGGFFFTPPSLFDVTFFMGDKVNTNLNTIRRSVLVDVTVDYSPNGQWAVLRNGAPVQTTLTLQFRETELVDRTSIENEHA